MVSTTFPPYPHHRYSKKRGNHSDIAKFPNPSLRPRLLRLGRLLRLRTQLLRREQLRLQLRPQERVRPRMGQRVEQCDGVSAKCVLLAVWVLWDYQG